MIRARGLLLGGACFATLAGFTVAVSSTAALPGATTAHTAAKARAAMVAVVGAAVHEIRVAAARRAMTSAFASAPGASDRVMSHRSANAPLIPTQTVSGVSPNAGASGAGGEQVVTITGSGFSGATDVFFGPLNDVNSTAYPCLASAAGCFQITNDNQILADTPVVAAGTVDVTVGSGTASSGDQYSYFDPPTVTNVATPQHQGASGIAVVGTNFSYPGVTPFASGVSEVDLVPTGGGSTVAITAVCSSGGQAKCFLATDDTDLTVNLPNSMTAGQYHTEAMTPGGTSSPSSADLLVVLPPSPTLASLNPSSGTTLGGNDVVLTGTDFTGVTAVNFGSSMPLCGTGTCYTVDSSTQITVNNIPAHAAGGVSVTVTTTSGTTGSKTYLYVTPVPTLTNLNPSSGSGSGGNNVVLTGTNFNGATDVNFGTSDITNVCGTGTCYTVDSSTQITVDKIPSHASGGVNVNVVTPGGTTGNLTYTYLGPTLTNLNPPSGSTLGGNNVILTGTNLTGATDVNFGSTDITNVCGTGTCFTVDSSTQITVSGVPSHGAGSVNVNVVTPGGTTGNLPYTYIVPPPTLTNLNPSSGSGSGGNNVVLTGTNFNGATDVNFGASDVQLCGTGTCFTIDSTTQITVDNVPAHAAGGVSVSVTTPGGTTGTLLYTYVGPTLTNLDSTSGSTVGGNSVVLAGSNFIGATDVHVGSIDLSSCPSAPCFTVNSDIQITVIMPADTPGMVNVNVTTPGGTTASLPYTYVAPGPTVTGVSPNAGALTGGNTVALTGSGFEAAGTPITSQVTVGTAPAITSTPCVTSPTAPCFTVNSPTSITVEVLPPGTGMVHFTVTTPGGTSTPTSADVYTYVTVFPNVATVSPKFGAASGNAYVTVVGSNFGDPSQGFGATDVVFGAGPGAVDVPASRTFPCPGSANGCFEQIGTTTLDVYAPAVAASTVDIRVVTPGGTSNAGVPDQYTFVAKGAYTAVSPFRICDTRPAGKGITANQCDGAGKGTLVPGRETITVLITGAQIPPGAQAVVANISVINHGSGSTFVTAFPAGGSQPLAANINLAGGKVESNLAIVRLGSGGQISLFNSVGSADVIVDVEGYFAAPGGAAGAFHSIPPLRICDSRAGTHTACAGTTSTPLQGGAWRRVVLSGVPPGTSLSVPHIPADGTAAAAAFNLTGTAASASTYLSVTAPTGSDACPTKAPAFANLNPTPGISLPNRVISNLGPNQDICLFSAAGSINFIIDVNGWFGNGHETTTGGFFYSVPPTRICDTRPSDGTRCQGQQLTANHSQVVAVAGIVAVPAWNSHAPPPLAVVANLTGIAGSAATYLTLYPSDVTPHPIASDLNPSAGQVIGDLAITSLAQTGSTVGNDNLYNAVGTINAVLDVAGWFQ